MDSLKTRVFIVEITAEDPYAALDHTLSMRLEEVGSAEDMAAYRIIRMADTVQLSPNA